MVAQNYAQLMGPSHFFVLGLEEIIEPEELTKLFEYVPELKKLNAEISAQQVRPLRQKMTELYGQIGARGIAMCSGRAAFVHLLRQQGDVLGFSSNSFRFLPGRLKLHRGLSFLADWMEKTYHEEITIENAESVWNFQIGSCTECSDSRSTESICDFTSGLLQGFLTWAGGGKYYRIVETDCRGRGDDFCTFRIDKSPLD